jgi:hypothetical protein
MSSVMLTASIIWAMMEAAGMSETSVDLYEITQISEDRHLRFKEVSSPYFCKNFLFL